MNTNNALNAQNPGLAPKISDSVARQVLDDIKNDEAVKAAIVESIYNGELEGLNDSLRPFRRTTHRGSRAEEQAVSFLGEALMLLDFESDEMDNQFRFVHFDRYLVPVRFLLVRANKVDGEFKTWKKGDRAKELMNENYGQLILIDVVETKGKDGIVKSREYDGAPILNVWILADGSSEANKEMDALTIHLAIPTGIRRGSSWIARQILDAPVRAELWTGSLGAPLLSPQDLPESAPIQIEIPIRRQDEAEGEAVA